LLLQRTLKNQFNNLWLSPNSIYTLKTRLIYEIHKGKVFHRAPKIKTSQNLLNNETKKAHSGFEFL